MNQWITKAVALAAAVMSFLFVLGALPGRGAATEVEPTAAAEDKSLVIVESKPESPEAEMPVTEHVFLVNTESEEYQACAALAEGMGASQIVVYDGGSDEVLYTKTVEGGKLYPASITKLFSAYVALQHLDADDVVTAGDELELVRPGSSMAYIYKGQSVTLEMAVQAMMLPSGNDAAYIVAANVGRAIAGDESLSAAEAVQAFVDEMNETADELGFKKSHFCNPDGYHVGAHYTCLNDMTRIAKLALEDPVISKYMNCFEADVTYYSGETNHWKNTNYLLDPESEYYNPDAVGMKTGHTSQAGWCLMSAFQEGDRTIVVGVFGYEDKLARFEDVAALVEAVA